MNIAECSLLDTLLVKIELLASAVAILAELEFASFDHGSSRWTSAGTWLDGDFNLDWGAEQEGRSFQLAEDSRLGPGPE